MPPCLNIHKPIVGSKHRHFKCFLCAPVKSTRKSRLVWDWRGESLRLETQLDHAEEKDEKDSLFEAIYHVQQHLDRLNEIIRFLSRRKLALTADDLLLMLRAAISDTPAYRSCPINPAAVIKQLEFAAKTSTLNEETLAAAAKLRETINTRMHHDAGKLIARLDKLLNAHPTAGAGGVPLPPGRMPAPVLAGRDDILVDLKSYLGLMPGTDIERTVLAPDDFGLRADSPLTAEHALISEILNAAIEQRGNYIPDPEDTPQYQQLLDMDTGVRGGVLLAAFERAAWALGVGKPVSYEDHRVWQSRRAAANLPGIIEKLGVSFDRTLMSDALLKYSALSPMPMASVTRMLNALEPLLKDQSLTDGERHVLHRLRCMGITQPPMGRPPRVVTRICELLGEADGFWLVPGEHWAETVHTDIVRMNPTELAAWFAVFQHAATASTAKPSAKWIAAARPLIETIGTEAFAERVTSWFNQVSRGRSFKLLNAYTGDSRGASDTFNEGNANILRGLVWMLADHPDAQSPRLLADLLSTSIKKVPGIGPRAVKLANACVWALGKTATNDDQAIRIASLGQLARLKATVTFRTTLKMIEKALDKAAEATGIGREDLEEMSVPTYGMERVGQRTETLGDFTAELIITGTGSTELRWIKQTADGTGKTQKSVPKAVKDHFADDLKELKSAAKDIEKMLPAQRDRLDKLHLRQKTWAYQTWVDRYLNHPLTGTLARRLIWSFSHGEDRPSVHAAWLNDRLVDAAGEAVEIDPDSVIVSLWHPIGQTEADILAWRSFFEQRRIKQPFKQAHREVYLLTDAERHTNVYSNRYAAHLIKQHQFNALCGVRGWHNKLRLMVDDTYPPATLRLPEWQLRAEFWVEGAGDNYGTDTTDSGSYLYLATDQVRFYPLDAAENAAHAGGGGYNWSRWRGEAEPEPIPLDEIPPLVFSEVMRDVDLFVGVASVGNDPAWEDGGRQERYGHAGYWHSYSFGDLSGTATTRKQVLERLVPRLKIADRCAFTDKFLVVRGAIRTYKIHLGSGNILMEPNDQYLCIVPKPATVNSATEKVFLPFEGDRTLSIILSKAFMLAEDQKVSDPTIVSQIKR